MPKPSKYCGVSLADALSAVLDKASQSNYPSVRSNVACILRHLDGDMPLAEIKRPALVGLVDAELAAGNAASTCNRKLSTIASAFTWALDRGFIEDLPCRIPWQKEPKHRIAWLSEEQEARLVATMAPELIDLMVVLIDTGLRRGEALRLNKQDVHEDKGYLAVWQTKTEAYKNVPMTLRVAEIIARRLQLYPSGPLFPELTVNQINYLWNKSKAAAALPDLHIHDLRHTTASRLMQRGANIYVVKEIMGHASVSTTERYAHLDGSEARAVMELLNTHQ